MSVPVFVSVCTVGTTVHVLRTCELVCTRMHTSVESSEPAFAE